MKLLWYIHDKHCLTVETGAGRKTPAIEWRAEALRRVSAGWDREPDRHTIEMWLRGALPENGSLETFESHGLRTIAERGLEIGTGTIHDWVWGNAHWEYPGAVRFERAEDTKSPRPSDGYTPLDETELGERLRNAANEADRMRQWRTREDTHRKSSLPGARGKIAVHIDEAGRTCAPKGRSLSTWIVKVENQPEWPGEAGVESVCQRALTYLGIDAARTTARIIDGIPVVMSQRSDRTVAGGKVVAKHQEDWLQAYGKPPPFKSDERGPDLGFRSLYAILRRYGDEAQTKQVTRLIAAACAMCNGDLHRKNIAIAHGPPEEPFGAKLAPVYDFSSQCGVARTGDHLTIAVAGMIRAGEVDESRWHMLAEQCRLDPEETARTAAETALHTAEALAAAREQAKGDDEWREPKIVEQRIESSIRAAQKYARICQAATSQVQQETRRRQRSEDNTSAERERAGQSAQSHASAEAKAPTPQEIETAQQYLRGHGERPGLDRMVDKIATERLDGSAGTQTDAAGREFDIYWALKPHTRERPEKENQWRLDRENRAPVRSKDAALITARTLAKALDEYQHERYGETEDSTPRGPPNARHFAGWTARGRERKRERLMAETIEHWRTAMAPDLLREIREAIIPLEVEFRRQLARERETDKRSANAEHRLTPAQLTHATPSPQEWDWD